MDSSYRVMICIRLLKCMDVTMVISKGWRNSEDNKTFTQVLLKNPTYYFSSRDVSHPVRMLSQTVLAADPGLDTVTSSFDDALWIS